MPVLNGRLARQLGAVGVIVSIAIGGGVHAQNAQPLPAAACESPSRYCGAALQPVCLDRVGAGAMAATDAADQCGAQFERYRNCLAEVVATCGETRGAVAAPSSSNAMAVWNEIKDLGDPDLLDAFAAEHAGTTLAALAAKRASSLRAASDGATSAADPGRSTVFVQSTIPGAPGSYSTGFVVAPDLILTAAHVVGDDETVRVRIGSPSLPSAETIADVVRLGPLDQGPSRDFALLRVADAGLSPLPLTGNVGSGTPVVAYGFPGVLLSQDAPSQAFVEGRPGAVAPSPIPLDGKVLALQTSRDGARLISHSAPISPGTSGGPLVDVCGRAVGMNFAMTRSGTGAPIGLAVHSEDVLRFLRSAGVTLASDDTTCRP